MKLIIAGSRTVFANIIEITSLLEHFKLIPTEIISGTARGIDMCGEDFAKYSKLPCKRFPADWDQFGKSAGYRRNIQMGEYADALLLIWDGKSKGSFNMKQIMNQLGKPFYEVVVKPVDVVITVNTLEDP